MEDYDKVIIYTAFASYMAAVVQGICTFGDGVTFHLLWHIAFLVAPEVMSNTPYGSDQLQPATLILSVRAVPVQAYFSYRSIKALCMPLLRIALPLQIIMIILGAVILKQFHASSWLRPLLGIVFAVIAAFFTYSNVRRIWQENNKARQQLNSIRDGTAPVPTGGTETPPRAPEDVFIITRTHQIGVAIGSFSSGFLAGLVGVAGPPLMIVTLVLNLPQRVLRGTFPFAFFVGYLVRFLLSLAGGLYDPNAWMLYVAGALGGVAGLPVGLELGGLLPHDVITLCICWLIFFAAVSLAELSGVWVALSIFCSIMTLAGYGIVKYRLKQKRRRVIAAKLQEEEEEKRKHDLTSDDDADRNPHEINLKSIEGTHATHHLPPATLIVESLVGCARAATQNVANAAERVEHSLHGGHLEPSPKTITVMPPLSLIEAVVDAAEKDDDSVNASIVVMPLTPFQDPPKTIVSEPLVACGANKAAKTPPSSPHRSDTPIL